METQERFPQGLGNLAKTARFPHSHKPILVVIMRTKKELFAYIEVFYNQRRRHSTLGQISPAAFERQAAA